MSALRLVNQYWLLVVCSLLLFSSVFLLLSSPTYAQDVSTGINAKPATAPEVASSTNWDAYMNLTWMTQGFVNAGTCFLSSIPTATKGCPITSLQKTTSGEITPTTMVAYNGEGGGLIGASGNYLAQIYENQPVSGVYYASKSIKNGLGIVSPAYAQVGGSGGAVLAPVENLWKLSRNLAYLFFTLIFVAVGFMIMFRSKLNPQTVISIQNALPGLVMGLIFIYFSFFIAGLIVDLAFLLSQVFGILILTQAGGTSVGGIGNASAQVQDFLNNQNIFTLIWDFMGGWSGVASNTSQITSTVGPLINNTIGGTVSVLAVILGLCFNPIGFALMSAGGPIGWLTCGGLGLAGGVGASQFGGNLLVTGFVYLVLLIGILQVMVRVLFSLIGSYLMIIALTVFGPFFILFSAIPGNGGVFSSWWRQLLANALVFPAVFLMLVLVKVILSTPALQSGSGATQSLPLFGGNSAMFIPTLISYGMILALPAVPGFVKEMLKAKTNPVFSKAITGNVKTGIAGATLLAGTQSIATMRFLGGGGAKVLKGIFPAEYWKRVTDNLTGGGLGESKK